MVSLSKMTTAWCTRLRFLLTIYICVFKGVCVLLLYERLLIVVCVLVVNHAFYLSEAGSMWSHLLAACEEISLVIGRAYIILHIHSFLIWYIVAYLTVFFLLNQMTHDALRLNYYCMYECVQSTCTCANLIFSNRTVLSSAFNYF